MAEQEKPQSLETAGATAPRGGGATPPPQPQVNWAGVLLAAAVMVMAVALIGNVFVRVVVSLIAFLGAFQLVRPTAAEPDVEQPLVYKTRGAGEGLDRRKYGKLRAYTQRLLEHVRSMNRLAVDARQGKMTHRHAHAELDRLAEMMRGVVAEVRKAAGVPTPSTSRDSLREKRPQPQVAMPKDRQEEGGKGEDEYGSVVDEGDELGGAEEKELEGG